MKGKLGTSKKKKTIALIAVIAILLAGATTGVTLFLKDDGSASAAQMEQNQTPGATTPSDNNGQTPDGEMTGENTSTEPEQNPGEEQQNPENNPNENEGQTGETEEGTQTRPTRPGTTGGTTANAGATLPQESITYRDRLVAEDFLVGWTPVGITAITNTADRFLNSPKLQIEKLSYTETDYNKDGDVVIPESSKYTAVQVGESIIYEIRVSNIGNRDAKDIKISDKIPEGTTLELIDNKGVENNGAINWVMDIPAGTMVSLKFAVTVNEDAKGEITNVAVVNGDETNKTENTVIETEKLAEVTRNGNVVEEAARPGDTVKYTVKMTNTGKKDTTTKVTDILPANTSLVKESITEGGKEENRIITWEEVTVEAGKTKEISFSVTVDNTATESIKNVAIVGKTPTNETENKVANITGTKSVDKQEAKAGETLTYTITLSNSGNADGKVTVTDKIPAGTTIADATLAGYDKETNTMKWTDVEVKAGEKVELTLAVVIDVNTTTSVVNTAILDGEEIPEKPETKVANITGTKSVDKAEAKVGETLTYKILLSNSGNTDGKVTVTDEIPAGTTIKDATIAGYDKETNTMTWTDVEVKAGEEVELTLEVVIDANTTTSVVNTAILDSEEIPEKPETKVANITAVKASIADEPLKEKGNIKYTITLHNSGNTSGKVTVIDEVPEGTTLVPNSIKIDGMATNNIALENRKITWGDVEVEKSADVVLSFEVTVNPFEEETKQIVNNKATLDGKPVNSTTDEAEKAYIELVAEKQWNDNSDIAEKRPESIKILVKDGNTIVTSQVLTGTTDTWSHTFTKLPKYDAQGNEISYTIAETVVDGDEHQDDLYFYTQEELSDSIENGYVITNTFSVPDVKVSVSVEKVWNDNTDSAKKRPESIYLVVKNGETIVRKQEVTVANTNPEDSSKWNYTFTELDKYNELGNEINYTVEEQEVEENDLYFYAEPQTTGNMADGYVITNTFSVPDVKVSVPVEKVWNDNSDSAKKRPASIKLQLKANDVNSGEAVTITGNGNTWNYTFENLAKYDANGDEISYAVEEQEVKANDLYFYANPQTTGNMTDGYVITNTFSVPDVKVRVPVEKVWNDNSDSAKKRPASIKLQLKANGANSGEAITVTGSGNTWNYTFENLAKYDANGDVISYTVEEQEVKTNDLYFYANPQTTGNMTDGYVITNTFSVPNVKVSVPVEKVWNDNSDSAKKRPASIKLQLKANGVNSGEAVTITGNGNTWNYTFENLAKYDANGDVISYIVEEQEVKTNDLYFYANPQTTGNMTNGYVITNTFSVPDVKVSVPVEKVWNDNNDEAKKRPASIKLQLKANGVNSGEAVTITGNGNTWNYTFENLAKYDANGDVISYTVEEQEVKANDLYFYANPQTTGNMTDGYVITNTFSVPNETVNVEAKKVWSDNSNSAQKRPTSIILQVKAAGEIVRQQEVTGNTNEWSYQFEGLRKYDRLGNVINYTVDEAEVTTGDLYFYSKNINEYTITNTFTVPSEKVSVTITKQWNDNDNEANKRPLQITLQVKNGNSVVDEITLSGSSNSWSHTFENLPKYDANGNIITYTASEAEVTQGDLYFYTQEAISGNMANGYVITNTFSVPNEKVEVAVTKQWNDNSDSAKKRPASIKLQLKANDVNSGEAVTVTGSGNTWNYTFKDLPKYDRLGNIITYTVDEEEVKTNDLYFYKKDVTGYVITNTFSVPDVKVSIPVEKVWNDNADSAKKRPASIKLQLKANGVNSGNAVTITGNGNTWNYTFENLAKYDANGDVISYTVEEQEVKANDLYFYANPQTTGNMADGYVITNTFSVPDVKVSVPVEKVWNDNSDSAKKRPASIKLQLKANGVNSGNAVTITGNGNTWNYTFENLAKYDANGNVISYTVEEQEVKANDLYFYANPQTTGNMTDGYVITNTFSVPDVKVSVPVEKVWNDNADSAKKRPASIKLQLKANGVNSGNAVTITGNGNTWNYTFESLAKYDANGDVISYTVAEQEVKANDLYFYAKPQTTGNMTDGYVITNTFSVPDVKIPVTITKKWVDTVAQSAHRPESITLQVKNGDVVVQSHEVTVTNAIDNATWSYTFTGLDKYDESGNEINYTAGEVMNSKFYVRTDNGTNKTVTNTFTRPTDKISVTITKKWVDTEAQSKHRPESVTLQVKNGDTVVQSHEVTVANAIDNATWSYTFTELDKYDENGNEINYTAGEIMDSKFYTRTDNGTSKTVTNTFTRPTDKTELTVTKVWEDNNNSYGARPSSIKVQVKNGGAVVAETILSGSATQSNWSYTFTSLDQYDQSGDEISYKVEESEIKTGDLENYRASTNGNTITNTYMPPVLNVKKSSTTASTVKAGDTISYTITVTNEGDGIARNVTVRDDLDLSKVSFVGASDGGTLNGNQVVWTIDSLAAKTGSKTVTLTVKVRNTAKLGAEITNIATVDGGQKPSEPVKHKVETVINTLQQSETVTGTNVVIVLDLSASMNNKIDGVTRLQSAKEAAEGFINKIFPDGITTGNQVSVVTFNFRNASDQTSSTSKETASKYKGTKVFTFGRNNQTIATSKSDANNLISAIKDIELGDNLGTNIAAALEVTKTQVEVLKVAKPENRNVVVFLGDGAPSPWRKENEWVERYQGNVESNIVDLAGQIKAITNTPSSEEEIPINTVIHTIGFGVNNLDDNLYAQCCTDSSHSGHLRKNRKYIKDTYGYYYHQEKESDLAKRILQRMSSGEGYYHLSDNGAGLINNFNSIFSSTTTSKGTMTTTNGIGSKVLLTKLDTSKAVVLTVNGVAQEVAYSDFAANGLSYTEVGTTYTLTWDVTKYDANTTLQITYNTL